MTGAAPALAALLVAAAVLCLPRRVAGWGPVPGPAGAGDATGTDPTPAGRLRLPWRRPRREAEEAELISLVEALGAALDTGLGPADALEAVLSVRPPDGDASPLVAALPALLVRARTGDGLGPGWEELARAHDDRDLLLLARAWTLSERTGAPLAAAAHTTARLVRADRDRRRAAEAAVAGARATMTILTLLPVGGPLLALLLGLDLGALYASSPLVWAALAAAVVLVVAGRVWVGRLVAHALRGPELR